MSELRNNIMTAKVANIADIVEIVGLKVSNSSAKTQKRKRCGAPPHPFPPNPFAVRGRPGALALQLVSSSSSSSRKGVPSTIAARR